jgi:cell shape-determining protein MreC
MDYKELLEKYQALLVENNRLKEEIKRLQRQQGIPEQLGD